MNTSFQTLLHGVESAGLDLSGLNVLLLNAIPSDFVNESWVLQSYFKPYVEELSSRGLSVSAEAAEGGYDVVLYLLPKNMVEARYELAKAVRCLNDGGRIFCAADNKAGGTRLKKLFESFGIDLAGHDSRNKARVVWGSVRNVNDDAVSKALSEGRPRAVIDDRFISQAGVFGWDKIDKGSEVLTRYIPRDLKGKGADFGCGYGYLSDYALSHCSKIKRLTCLDADYRAVEMCRKNLERYDADISYVWADLTKVQMDLRNLDFILMNPPFHEGKKQDIGIGIDFIKSAYQSLKRGGSLFIVANAHLSYEPALEKVFFAVEKLHEGQGFKVFKAVR
jgi:16S rRNA (guanine1207-N2)-methyltransferase